MGSWENYTLDANFSFSKIKSTSVGYLTDHPKDYDMEAELFRGIHSKLNFWITEKKKKSSTGRYTNVEKTSFLKRSHSKFKAQVYAIAAITVNFWITEKKEKVLN